MSESGIQKGECQHRSKITEKIARQVLDMLSTGQKQKDIAAELSIGTHIVRSIANKLTWSWLKGCDEKIQLYNQFDKQRHSPVGSSKGNSKLSEKQAVIIYKSNKPNVELARQFNVSKTLVYNIKHRISWKHIHI